MFAQLTYATGATLTHVLNDIAIALTGGTVSSMSASINQSESSIDNTPGGVSTWTALTDPTAITDNPDLASGMTFLGGKLLRQLASTSTGTQYKYLKYAFVAPSGGTNVRFALNFGKGISGTTITGGTKWPNYQTCSTLVGVRATTTFTHALKVQVYSSGSATLVQIAQGDLFSYVPCLAVFDFARVSPDLDIAGNLCTVISNCGTGDVSLPTLPGHMYMASTTIEGKVFPVDGTNTVDLSAVVIGTPDLNAVLGLLYSPNKFAGFSTVGDSYDLLNIGITRFNMYTSETQGQTWYTDHICCKQIPYSSITDITGVYGCNVSAFGKDGAFFNTPLGTMCKFGPFMVGV